MINDQKRRTLWVKDKSTIQVIDQRKLPHDFIVQDITSVEETIWAIKEMVVRGAPLIGATAAYGMYFAAKEAQAIDEPNKYIATSADKLKASRPTGVNLSLAIERQLIAIKQAKTIADKITIAFQTAHDIVEEDVQICRQIGEQGLPIIEAMNGKKEGEVVNILTHCNAGMLGCIEWGTVTSPIYQAHAKGIPVHVWVDETRPRNQGANLTAWELTQHGIPHTIIVDNAGGHLMQHGMVDMVIVGTDRTTRTGDVANKIGTYLKALAAYDNNISFYVALPSTTIDWQIADGLKEIPIEERSPNEVKFIYGKTVEGKREKILITLETSSASNYGFDVTPARLVTALITEKGVCKASEEGLKRLFGKDARIK
jgi:methylthioribose-1-phosphate isomerase